MFKELQLADGSVIVGTMAFLVSFGIFLIIVIGALRCSRSTMKKLENLPLDDNQKL